MAHVGQGTVHKNQVDELDAEIAAMEQDLFGIGEQQPQADPEAIARNEEPVAEEIVPEESPQQKPDDVVDSVDDFLAEPAEEPQEVEEEPSVEEPVTQTASGRRSWKNDYLELENRYKLLRQSSDHFKFETRQQIGNLQNELAAAQERNADLQMKLQEYIAQAQTSNVASAFSSEDIDVLGESTVKSFQTAIDTAVKSATQPLQNELLQMKKSERDRLKQQSEANRSQAYQSFSQRLADLVPDYPTINVDPGFVKWLKQPSPYSGAERLKLLHQAEASGDVERVAQFFVEWKQLTRQPEQTLEQHQTPSGRGGGSGPPAPPQQRPGKRRYTMAFVNKFYEDDIAGKYVGREALRDKLDAEIDLALKEGRVV